MHRSLLALALASCAVFLIPTASEVSAKRKPLPKTTVCNTTKADLKIARMSYAGRGRWASRGWRTVEAGKCVVTRAGTLHVAGRTAPPKDATATRRNGCVIKGDDNFSLVAGRGELGTKAYCDRKGGTVVTFFGVGGGTIEL